MNPYIVEPNSISVANRTSEAATYPAINVTGDEPQMTWRTTASGSAYILLTTAQPVDTVALIWTNLRATDQIRVRAANSEAATTSSPLYDSGNLNAWSGVKASPFRAKSIVTLPGAVSYSHWRIDIIATGHPDGFIEVARVVLGKRTEWNRGIGYGCSQIVLPQSLRYEGAGYSDIDQYASLPGWKVSFSWISNSDWRDIFYPLLIRVSSGTPVLFVPQPDLPATWQQEVVFGRFQPGLTNEHRFFDGWTTEFTINGLSL